MIKDSGSTVTLTIRPPNGKFNIMSKILNLINSHTYFLSDDAANTISLPLSNKV